MNVHKIGVALLVAVCLMAAPAAAGPYTITDLGTLGGGTFSNAYGISADGRVAGEARLADNAQRGFYYEGAGPMVNIGTLGGTYSLAEDVNSAGVVVGRSNNGASQTRAISWTQAGGIVSLGTLNSGSMSQAYAINDSSEITGWSYNPSLQRAFLWLPVASHGLSAGMNDLGAIDGQHSMGYGINSSADVAGWSTFPGGGLQHVQAALWDSDTHVMTGLGFLGSYQDSVAYAINDSGTIIGEAYSNGVPAVGRRGWVWQNGSLTEIGTFGGTWSRAMDINNAGQVVGSAYTSDEQGHAFIYDVSTGTLTNLEDLLEPGSGWTRLYSAAAINDAGQIVGYGRIGNQSHAFLLTAEQVAVPEPASVVLPATGVACALGLLARRRTTEVLKQKSTPYFSVFTEASDEITRTFVECPGWSEMLSNSTQWKGRTCNRNSLIEDNGRP